MKINGSWQIIESREKYKNHWMKVCEDQVIRPDGKDGIVCSVELTKGVLALPIGDDGSVYLIDQFRYVMEKNSIEVAGGGIDDGENPLDAAKRELKEELGIEAREWIDLGVVNPFTTIIRSSQKMFLARGLTFGEDAQDVTENIKMVKVKMEEAVKMVMDGIITHSPSCVLILKANEYKKSLLLSRDKNIA